MPNLGISNWIPILARRAEAKNSADLSKAKDAESDEQQLTPRAQPESSSQEETEPVVQSKDLSPTEHGLDESGPIPDDSVTEHESLSHDQSSSLDQSDVNSSFTSYHSTEEDDDLDDDKDFLLNTRNQTPKEDVVNLKWDLINERKQVRKEQKSLADYKAYLETIWEGIHARNVEQLQKETRGKPKPPRLGSEPLRPLYNNLLDRLKECTILVLLNRAQDNFKIGEYQRAEIHAKQALVKYASGLNYEPLSAWCHFYIGKAQYGAKRYDEAVSSFAKARTAVGLYIREELLEDWDAEAKAAELRRINKGATGSAEMMPRKKSLADELAGRGDSNSSDKVDW